MSCSHPIEPALLEDYWLGEVPVAQQEEVEQHLLGCRACAGELERIAAVALAVRDVARKGRVRLVISAEFLDRLSAQGLRLRQYSPPKSGSVACTVTPHDDLLVARLPAELGGLKRIDLAFYSADGTLRGRLIDVPFNAARGEVIFNEPVTPVMFEGPDTLIVKMIAPGPEGERVIGEYTFNHTPS